MSLDEEETKIADVVRRMQVSPDFAQQYKRRLVDAGVIEQPRRGIVAFAVPYLQEYLRNE